MTTIDAARRGRDGDEDAWRVLNAKIREVVLDKLDSRDLPPGYDADDLVQIVSVQIWRTMAAFNPDAEGASFRGWVWTVRHRKLTDLWRKARSGKEQKLHVIHTESVIARSPGTVDFPDPHGIGQSTLFGHKELQVAIDRAMAGMGQRDCEILRLREEEHLDYEQIASRLGYNKAVSARVRYHRARDERKAAVKLCFAGYDLPGQ